MKKIQNLKSLIRNSRGQIVLILVLVTIVGLTVGLSLISRTVTDVRMSSQIEQSGRAFSAAEAGIETALRGSYTGAPPSANFTVSNVTVSYSTEILGLSSGVLILPLTEVGNTQTVWLVNHNSDGSLNETVSYAANDSLDICFGKDNITKPAIIVSLIYKEGSVYKVAKAAYDVDATGFRGNNFYTIPYVDIDTNGSYCNGKFPYKVTLTPSSSPPNGFNISGTLLALRIHPRYINTPIGVKPSNTGFFPDQGKTITSIGKTETGIVRKIQVVQGFTSMPSLLDFGLFVEKND